MWHSYVGLLSQIFNFSYLVYNDVLNINIFLLHFHLISCILLCIHFSYRMKMNNFFNTFAKGQNLLRCVKDGVTI
jgi:hypothetical protein